MAASGESSSSVLFQTRNPEQVVMVTQIKRANEFVQECWTELQRVTWPDWPQLKNATLVVIVFCLIVAMIIWGMDVASRFFIDIIMGIFGA